MTSLSATKNIELPFYGTELSCPMATGRMNNSLITYPITTESTIDTLSFMHNEGLIETLVFNVTEQF